MLLIRSRNIKVEYKSKVKKANEKCNIGGGFDDTFKADNQIFSIVSMANGMTDWMVRNFNIQMQMF